MAVKIAHFLATKQDGYIDYSNISMDPNLGLEFERIDWESWFRYGHEKQHYALYAFAVYLPVIFGIQYLMKNRKPFDLRRELCLWNVALGIFSMIAFARLVPYVVSDLYNYGPYDSICTMRVSGGTIMFWGLAFAYSKFVELGDTVFIVLRKKPLVFLQWYHHLSSLFMAWVTLPYAEPSQIYCAFLNYGVHSLMYTYFAFRAVDVKIPRQIANVITTLQLLQMFAALGIQVYTSYSYYFGNPCYRHPNSMRISFFIYGSFVILFAKLFKELVLDPRKSKSQ